MRNGVRQINKAEYDVRHAAAMERWETPVSQQSMESHVRVPFVIALVISIFCAAFFAAVVFVSANVLSGFSEYPINAAKQGTAVAVFVVWAGSFLVAFLWRIGVGDALLWKLEEAIGEDIDGDGEIGYAPRSVPLNTKSGTRDVPLEDKPSKLKRAEWQQVAIAILNKQGNVSWRGIYKNCDISQSKAQAAAKYLNKGYSDNFVINGRGWDFLVPHLPENAACMIERPDDDTDPPTRSEGG